MNDSIQGKKGVSRRNFLGLAAIGTVILSFLAALAGMLRLTKSNVYYEESKRVKIGKPENFPVGTVKKFEGQNFFVFADNDGLHAISSVCTHLGCLVAITERGFQCPCHGSKYNQDGKVIAGPAPRSLPWLDISRNVDGSLVVDAGKEVKKGTVFTV
ncbi:MAG: Rieske 2Fe-2S domain-containing protein [Desulfobulbaceae bacterium]|nr:Rieske 2Fe-2S domain-containing protein [Desulfobulbaceae bacterium]